MLARLRTDVVAVLLLLILAVIFFWPVVGGGKTLLPIDNLYQWLPWQAQAASVGVDVPHNSLLSDLILENYPWKTFIVDSLRNRQLPLWNPYLFAGVPFLAAGQHSALYPLSVLFYVLPLPQAYGYFAALTLFLAALNMYVFLRVLGARVVGGLIGAVTYAFSGFFVVSVVFPMIISAAAWLPLLLAVVELLSRRVAGRRTWLLIGGSLIVAIQFLAGHVEIAYYNMLVLGFYGLARAFALWRSSKTLRPAVTLLGQTAVMVMLGAGLAGVQLVPLLELVLTNFRQGSVSYGDVVGWAYPLRQIVTFFVPDFYGNPAHHSYFDLVDRTVKVVTDRTIFWGIKNYVEAGSYVGILPLLLAVAAVLRRTRRSALFAILAVLSLLFAFGTPLYALLFYGLPGYNQLHSAFRWVYPYTLCIAVLAGLATVEGREAGRGSSPVVSGNKTTAACWYGHVLAEVVLPLMCVLAGGAGLLLLVAIFLEPAPFVSVADALLRRSDLARQAFVNGQMLLSYEARNFALFFGFLIAAGVVVLLARRGWRFWPLAAVGVIVADLFIIGLGFNPRSDPGLLNVTPPSIAFLAEDKDVFRVATLDLPNQKLLNMNSLMPYKLHDIRGYDSIIPRRYTEFMNLIEGQGELLYNRIAPFYWAGSLDSALVDLLNVKYVVTTQRLANAKYSNVYDDGQLLIYRNERYLPRAFIVEQARVIEDETALREAMRSLDPRQEVLLEEAPPDTSGKRQVGGSEGQGMASIIAYTPNRVTISVSLPRPGYLVLADSYFPGWIAEVRPADHPEADAQSVPILRADYTFRAIALPAGDYVVVFRYSPLSLRIGLLAAVLSAVLMALLAATGVWGRLYHEEEAEAGTVRRVAKNSLLPMAANLTSRIVDFAFAIIIVRLLGPVGQGKFALAIVFIGYFDLFTNFGLDMLLTREIARQRDKANYYLNNSIALRLILWLLSLPLIAAYLYVMKLPMDTTITIIVFAVSLVPSNLAKAVSSVFYGFEKMEFTAAVTVITTVLNAVFRAIVLLAGMGIIGLAWASVFSNVGTMLVFFYALYTQLFRPWIQVDGKAMRWMLVESYPLLMNHLLATVFFRIDALLMRPLLGNAADAALGYYSTAYKFIDGLNIIPSYLTVAVFPVMSRYAQGAGDALRRSYIMTLRLLLLIALPVSVGTCLLADRIILLAFGPKMLPGSGEALAILIWFLPFSFINSVTQYALVAVNQQRFLTRAFLIGAGFNIVANLILIPRYSFIGAAVTTVLSEFVLFAPFYYSVRKNITKLPFVQLFWRPTVASLVMAAVIWLMGRANILLIVPAAMVVYGVVLVAIGGISQEDWQMVRRLRR